MVTSAGRARPITRYGTPVLHRRCAAVTTFDGALAQLVADMFASMYAAEGVGLAANQIGVDARVFVYDSPDATGTYRKGHVVNPVLTISPVAGSVTADEGCLSVSGQYAELARAAVARVDGFDQSGASVVVEGSGLLARCLQHEVDHLEGIVYVDRLPAARRGELLRAAGLVP